MTLISLDKLYAVAGVLLAYVVVRAARNRSCRHRLLTALLWSALVVIYLFGDRLPPVAVGWLDVRPRRAGGSQAGQRSE